MCQSWNVRASQKFSRRQCLILVGRGLLVAAALPVIGACTPQPQDDTIYMKPQNQLEPASLTIPRGARVTWQNIGSLPQTATCDPAAAPDTSFVSLPDGATAWDSGVLYPGMSWTYTFEIPGIYRFFSRVQPTPGMVGVIDVQDAG